MTHSVFGRDPATLGSLEIQIEGDLISVIEEVRTPTASNSDCWIAPGLVDLQVNGYRGIDLNADTICAEAVLDLTKNLANAGTTTWLPTIVTASHEDTLARLRVIASARALYPEVKHAIAAIHLEGPSISPQDGYRGAHSVTDIRPPLIAEFDRLQSAANGIIRLVTFSPHWQESTAYIRALKERGVIVAIGHTNASPAQIHAAVDAGATLSTHLGNGIAPELPRHPNPIWTQLAEDRLTATLIADGAHLSSEIFRVMLRAKTIDRAILISDSVSLAGAPQGEYQSPIGGSVLIGKDGAIRMPGTGLLAGSGIALQEAVARAPHLGACTLAGAIRMATHNPAVALGIARGCLHPGASADIILFRWNESDRNLQIADVLVRGTSIS